MCEKKLRGGVDRNGVNAVRTRMVSPTLYSWKRREVNEDDRVVGLVRIAALLKSLLELEASKSVRYGERVIKFGRTIDLDE